MTKIKRIFLILSFFFVFAIMAFAVPSSVACAYAEESEQVEEQPSEETIEETGLGRMGKRETRAFYCACSLPGL